MAAPTLNLDEFKTKLQGLKTRADALTSKKEGLLKEATIQEQNQQRAIQELKDLGFPQVEGMDTAALEAFLTTLVGDLTTSLGELEGIVTSTEKLLGITSGSLDLE